MDNINHFSYSMAKNIYRKGIDYTVALKLGVIEKPTSRALDLGTLVHAHLLGEKQEFVVKQYSDYRSKEAREWRDAQVLPIIDESEFETICTIAERIKSHPLASKLLLGENTYHEVKLKAKIEKKDWIGYADSLGVIGNEIKYGVDLKTTAQFDDFKWTSSRNDYDLQAAITEYYYLMTLFGDSDYMIIPSSGVDQISNLYSIALGMGLETKILLDNDKQGKAVANRLRKSFFENDEKAFKKVVLLHDKTGIEELISKATAKKLLEQLGIKYNSNETLIQNIEKSKISKIIFAKTFYDQYINNSQSLDKVTCDNFNKINDFAKN